MTLEFGLISNRENICDEFDEELLLWHIVSDCEFDDIECK